MTEALTDRELDELETEEEFLARYDIRKYPGPQVAADLAIFTIDGGELKALVIERGGHPEKGKLALPGGFVNEDETLDEAAVRELQEETSLKLDKAFLEQLKSYGAPGRDPRGYIVSVAYVALLPHVAHLAEAGDDAAPGSARFEAVSNLLKPETKMAFNHREILLDGLERVRAKLEYSPIATNFIDSPTVTISELRSIYEIVWGVELNTSNFRRKALSVKGWLEPAPGRKAPELPNTRKAAHYYYSSVREFWPPLRRP